jgi:hypothetical protein
MRRSLVSKYFGYYLFFILLTSCVTTELMYVSNGAERYTVYLKKGELIEVPWDNECEGYDKPYHITQYNNKK